MNSSTHQLIMNGALELYQPDILETSILRPTSVNLPGTPPDFIMTNTKDSTQKPQGSTRLKTLIKSLKTLVHSKKSLPTEKLEQRQEATIKKEAKTLEKAKAKKARAEAREASREERSVAYRRSSSTYKSDPNAWLMMTTFDTSGGRCYDGGCYCD
ncbi:uncharacterized protein BDZ83DRAFT_735046 [Colletotrichum acutatum]|uniref:Uncharacterized protein n=1 Tax=Glomerella acutata TaxID=27357 RepID=A0AAD8UCK1_GLOAC|nr:uncharacterized protein BDZ83DRAFT_735046 [Colletotrichum acutatum]KAK1711955.1 hypothetical protein BDZ83DRAFT_735046 [Colletotrichum acutatum]